MKNNTIHTSTSRVISPQPSSAKHYGSRLIAVVMSFCKVKGSEKKKKLETLEKKQKKKVFDVPMLT